MNTSALLGGAISAGIAATLIGVIAAIVGRHPDRPAKPPGRLARLRAWWTDRSRRRRLGLGLALGLTVLALTRWPVLAVACGAGVIAVPRVLAGRTAHQGIARIEALEQWTRGVSDRLSAGQALEQALTHTTARMLPAPIAGPVSTLHRRLSVHRMPTEQALRLFADELDDPMGDKIVVALIQVARRRGSGATAALSELARMAARDVLNRREVDAARAEHRTTIRWIVIFIAGFTLLALIQGIYIEPYSTPLGQLVLGLVAAFYGAALWWLHRLAKETQGSRLLGREAGR